MSRLKIRVDEFAKYFDHTLLAMNSTKRDVERICFEALREGFQAVCINPIHVEAAREFLKCSGVKVAAVVGFPTGQTFTEVKVKEAEMCVERGGG